MRINASIVWHKLIGLQPFGSNLQIKCKDRYTPKFGGPPGTRIPTNGFGDRYAAITSMTPLTNTWCAHQELNLNSRHYEYPALPLSYRSK